MVCAQGAGGETLQTVPHRHYLASRQGFDERETMEHPV